MQMRLGQSSTEGTRTAGRAVLQPMRRVGDVDTKASGFQDRRRQETGRATAATGAAADRAKLLALPRSRSRPARVEGDKQCSSGDRSLLHERWAAKVGTMNQNELLAVALHHHENGRAVI